MPLERVGTMKTEKELLMEIVRVRRELLAGKFYYICSTIFIYNIASQQIIDDIVLMYIFTNPIWKLLKITIENDDDKIILCKIIHCKIYSLLKFIPC